MRRAFKHVGTAIAVAGAVLAGTVAAAGPANAAGHTEYTAYTSFLGLDSGRATFHSWGDWFEVKDTDMDGYGIKLIIEADYDNGYVHFANRYHGGGSGTSAEYDWDFVEERPIRFKVCLATSITSGTRDCSGWKYATA